MTTYFEPQSRLQLTDKVRHLIRFSDFLLLITGESGVGKSRLLQELAPSASDNSVLGCRISVTPGLSRDALVSGLLAQMPNHSASVDTEQGRVEALNEQIGYLRDQGQRLLLAVDDADLLDESALSMLMNLQLANGNDDGTAPQLLLFGSDALAQRLNQPGWQEVLSGRMHHLQLEPFSEEEMQAYIQQTQPGGASMPEKERQTMAKASGGFPGRLNGASTASAPVQPAAPDSGLTATPDPAVEPPKPTGRKAFPLPPLHMAGIALILIVVTSAAAWLFAPGEPEQVVTVDNGDRVSVPLELSVAGAKNESGVASQGLSQRLAQQEERLKPPVADSKPEIVPAAKPEPAPVTADRGKAEASASVKVAAGTVAAVVPEKDTLPVRNNTASAVKNDPVVQSAKADKAVVEVARPALNAAAKPEPAAVKQPEPAPRVDTKERPPAKLAVAAVKPVRPEPVQAQPVAKPATPVTVEQVATTKRKVEVVDRSAPEAAKVVAAQPVRQPKAAQAVSSVPRNARIIADEKALLGLPSNAYALQLLGAREMKSVERFLKQYKDIDGLRAFATLFKGKPWYVVVYGSFDSRNAALKGAGSLPQKLRNQRPWARSMNGIHNDINKK